MPTLQAGIMVYIAIPGPNDPGYYVTPFQGLPGRHTTKLDWFIVYNQLLSVLAVSHRPVRTFFVFGGLATA